MQFHGVQSGDCIWSAEWNLEKNSRRVIATLHWDAVRNIAFWLAIVIFLWSAMGCLHLQHRHHNRRHPQKHSRHYHNLLRPSSSLKQLQQRTYPYLGECHHRRLRKNLQSRMHGNCVTGSEIALV